MSITSEEALEKYELEIEVVPEVLGNNSNGTCY